MTPDTKPDYVNFFGLSSDPFSREIVVDLFADNHDYIFFYQQLMQQVAHCSLQVVIAPYGVGKTCLINKIVFEGSQHKIKTVPYYDCDAALNLVDILSSICASIGLDIANPALEFDTLVNRLRTYATEV